MPELTDAGGPPSSAKLKVLKEMERLALLANESLDELRHRLFTYKAGDFWFPAGGISKEETDIPPAITVLVLGFAGTGKSSLVNLMYSVFGRSGFVPFAQTSSVLRAGRFFFVLIQEIFCTVGMTCIYVTRNVIVYRTFFFLRVL